MTDRFGRSGSGGLAEVWLDMPLVVLATPSAELRERWLPTLSGDGFEVLEFEVLEAENTLAAFRIVFERRPEAVVVDLDIDGTTGLELVRMLRATSDLAILAIAADGDPSASVSALEVGADDVVRPNTPREEVVARLRAAIRRSARAPQRQPKAIEPRAVVETGDLKIDRTARVVTKGDTQIMLTRTEYRLIEALAARVGQTVPHRLLLSAVWGEEFVDDTHYLRVYMGYLRQKLEDDPHHPRYLMSEWGIGYRLVQHPTTPPERSMNRPPIRGGSQQALTRGR